MIREDTDVIIAGGGFAGLYLASILTQEGVSVRLIEKNTEICETRKTWCCWPEPLRKSRLEQSVSATIHHVINRIYLGGKLSISREGAFVVLDERKALELLLRRCRADYLELSPGEAYQSHSRLTARCTSVVTDKNTYRGTLLIDAMGYDSPNLRQLNLDLPIYSSYTRKYHRITNHFPNTSVMVDLAHDGFPGLFYWSTPSGPDSFVVGTFKFATSSKFATEHQEYIQLRDHLDRYIHEIRDLVDIERDSQFEEFYGRVPLYKLDSFIQNEALLVGDAGSMASPGYGDCLQKVVKTGEILPDILRRALNSQDPLRTLREFDRLYWDPHTLYNYHFNQILARLMSTLRANALNHLFLRLADTPQDILYRALQSDLQPRNILFFLSKLARNAPYRQIFHQFSTEDIAYIFGQLTRVLIDIILASLGEEMRRASDRISARARVSA